MYVYGYSFTSLAQLHYSWLVLLASQVFIIYTKHNNYRKLATIANQSQSHLRNQIQDWKNILLRGYDTDSYDKHLASMQENDRLIKLELNLLSTESERLNFDLKNLGKIQSLQSAMTKRYIKALDLYHSSLTEGAKLADQYVSGLDKEPVQLLYDLTTQLQESIIKKDESAIMISIYAFLIAIALVMLLIIIYAKALSQIIRDIVSVVGKVSDGYLQNKCPHDGSNEFGQLSSEINQMSSSLKVLAGNMVNASTKLSESVSNMTTTSKEQESTVSEQATSTQEIVASSQEITQTAKELLNNMSEVAKAVDHAAETAQEGREDLQKMNSILGKMVSSSQEIGNKLSVLNEKISNISLVVTTINKVADQTNLLSINATIEADKAGEAGIGFSTVASEIRRLSDQTAIATWDIEQLVKEIQTAVSSGVMGMEKFQAGITVGVEEISNVGDKLSGIVEQVGYIGPHFIAVHEGMESQTEGAEQISTGVFQLGETVTDLLQSIRYSNSAIDEVDKEAKQLSESCKRFRVKG
ncbi:methyl-accepting chemotaxis protein [Psychromonas sp. KJ10-10]|uniref:methyl-accepting chemotaxis protein n=1 Tax=Psychromonas sp. KJ10-10 TaxID=3391823 RepID=UPI0039B49762